MAESELGPYRCGVRIGLMAVLFLAVANAWAGTTEVYFAPGGNPTGAVVRELGLAKSNVLVQAYSFTSAPIAKAVVDAHKRGVKVTAVLDKSQRTEKYSSADYLLHAGVPTFIDAAHAIAHNKIMIIDGHKILTGSFNFTKAAEEKNAENLLVIDDAGLARKYTTNWQAHAAHAVKYKEKPARKR